MKRTNGPPEPTAPGWHVRVSVTVLSLVPNEVLRPWMALESFARDKDQCWPGNKALVALMAVGSVRVVQAQIERLEDYGIVARRQLGGNRRVLVMVRRTAAEMTPTEWEAMRDRAARLGIARKALATTKATARRKYKPPTKVVG